MSTPPPFHSESDTAPQRTATGAHHWEIGSQQQSSRFLYLRIEVESAGLRLAGEEIARNLEDVGSHFCRDTQSLVKGCLLPASWTTSKHLPRSSVASGDLASLNAIFASILETPMSTCGVAAQDPPADHEIILSLNLAHAGESRERAPATVRFDGTSLVASLAHIKAMMASAPHFIPVVTLAEPTSEHAPAKQQGHVLFLSTTPESHPAVQLAKARCRATSAETSALLGQTLDLDLVTRDLRTKLPGFELPDLVQLGQKTAALARVISHLRAPGGCPWDREQTFASLRPFMIEEAYEAVEAADKLAQDQSASCAAAFADELGDVLLQIFLNAQLAAEAGLFNLTDVVEGLAAKMIRRHPHVFPDASASVASASSAQDVRNLWENIKANEARPEGTQAAALPSSLLKKAAKQKSLPTLEYAAAVSKRAAKFGFCWVALEDVWRDVESEIMELRHEILAKEPDFSKVEDEIGDVVYALANVVVHSKLNLNAPEGFGFDDAVRKAIAKFLNRFAEMEAIYEETRGERLSEERAIQLDLSAWNDLWIKAKKRRYR